LWDFSAGKFVFFASGAFASIRTLLSFFEYLASKKYLRNWRGFFYWLITLLGKKKTSFSSSHYEHNWFWLRGLGVGVHGGLLQSRCLLLYLYLLLSLASLVNLHDKFGAIARFDLSSAAFFNA
jgi:hypothetical protein